MLRIVDIGKMFSMSGYNVFNPVKDKTVTCPYTFGELEETMPKADLLIMGGGADIHPKLYKHKNVASHVGNAPSFRDLFESAAFDLAQKFKVPILGLCRGAQLVCAKSGGYLIQDIRGHAKGRGQHDIKTIDGRIFSITSAHHQMQWPNEINHVMVAVADPHSLQSASYDYTSVSKEPVLDKEPEIVYYPDTNCLGVQGHPEWMDVNSPAVVYVRELVNHYLLKDDNATNC
jgi:gamma-glutamyl-gamma-aminobutyrate hydrolase PuuD